MEINNNVDLTVLGSVLEIYQAVSLKADGQGMRYTCRLSEGRFICLVAKVSVYREIAVTIFLLTIILMVGKFFVKPHRTWEGLIQNFSMRRGSTSV